jgi:hypothetical protein
MTKFRAPYFVEDKQGVKAYCSECDARIRVPMQVKCDKCGIQLYWSGKKGDKE